MILLSRPVAFVKATEQQPKSYVHKDATLAPYEDKKCFSLVSSYYLIRTIPKCKRLVLIKNLTAAMVTKNGR